MSKFAFLNTTADMRSVDGWRAPSSATTQAQLSIQLFVNARPANESPKYIDVGE